MNLNRYLPWIGFIVIAGSVVVGAAAGMFLKPLVMLCAAALVAVLLPRPRLLLILTVCLMSSELTMQFMPGQTSLYMAAGTLFCLSAALGSFSGDRLPISADEKRIFRWVAGFALVLVVTAALRGSGLRLLGSDMWGGRPYVLLLFSAAVLIFSLRINLSALQCKRMLYGFCLAGLFPSLAAIALHYGGTDVLCQFVGQGDETTKMLSGMAGDIDPMFRLQIANVGATYMFLLMWLVLYQGGVLGRGAMLVCGLVGVVLTGISGHRISLLYGVVLSMVYILLDLRIPLFKRLVNWYTLSFVSVLAALVIISPHLPFTFQRSITWLPFVDVTADTRFDTDVTSAWRVEVWKRAFEDAPQYLLLGKGFAFSREEMLSYIRWSMNDYSFVLTSHNYHNGLVQILIDLGLPGLFFALGFVGVVLKVHWPYLTRGWGNPMLGHFHRVMLAGFIAQVIVYVFVGGGVSSFVILFFWTTMMEQVRKSDASGSVSATGSAPAQSTR